jgi:hypothetical protein
MAPFFMPAELALESPRAYPSRADRVVVQSNSNAAAARRGWIAPFLKLLAHLILSSACVLLTAHAAWAKGASTPEAPPAPATTDVRLVPEGPISPAPVPTFVVTHGMGGTRAGDRFSLLAQRLKVAFPEANVYRVDWSPLAKAEIPFGLPNPWAVAKRIDRVAAQAAQLLDAAGVDPAQTTLIGESFGVYVNAQVARTLGGVRGMLAFNPASEAAGYAPPDLRTLADDSWALASASVFDARRKIAERSLFLAAPPDLGPYGQHTFGIVWLRHTLDRGDVSWVLFRRSIPLGPADRFDATAHSDGSLQNEQPWLQPAAEAADETTATAASASSQPTAPMLLRRAA